MKPNQYDMFLPTILENMRSTKKNDFTRPGPFKLCSDFKLISFIQDYIPNKPTKIESNRVYIVSINFLVFVK